MHACLYDKTGRFFPIREEGGALLEKAGFPMNRIESYITPRMEYVVHVATLHPSGTRVHVKITGPDTVLGIPK